MEGLSVVLIAAMSGVLGGFISKRYLFKKTTRHVLWFPNHVVYIGWNVYSQKFYCVIGNNLEDVIDSSAHTNSRLTPIITIIENVTCVDFPHSLMERVLKDCARNARNEVTEWKVNDWGEVSNSAKTKKMTS
ncbi:MAG: hypothetical protein ACR2PX_25345 [Endozoicomonas sp.]|uniref:hypothetical protein n=1 Tax=Endozoicomonas sp. TaxID=1892382 RepID=UPI003D9B8351